MSTTSTATTDITATQGDPSGLDRAAFDRTAAARSAMRPEDAPHYTLDAFYAAGKALWIAPRVAAYRDPMLALPGFDVAHLDGFEDLARGLRFVQTELLRRIQRAKQVPELAAEGWRLRALMMSYAEALSYKGRIAPELIVRLREGSGYRDLVEDLSVLCQEFLALPAELTGPNAAVTRAEIARASELAHEINVRVGNAADVDLSQAALLDERRRLGGLLLRAHGQIRRAMTYLRWDEGDATELVPSLYVPGGGRKAAEPATEPPQELAELHEQLHEQAAAPPVHPEDDPFAAE